jgi:hypothetical protein
MLRVYRVVPGSPIANKAAISGQRNQPLVIIAYMRRWQTNAAVVLLAALGLLVLIRCH